MVKLGEVATYINGYAFKPSDWSNEGLPIIRIQDLTGTSYQANKYNGKYDSKYEINNGDVLISWSASLGVYSWNKGKALLNQHIFKVVFDKVSVNKDFFVFQVESLLKKAQTEAHGATMKHLTKSTFNSLPFYLPSIAEQEIISDKLNKVSFLIKVKEQQLIKYDEFVKSRFIEMFGNPVLNTKKWNVEKLKNLSIKITSGNTPKGGSNVYVDEGIMFFRSQNVWKNNLVLNDIAYIDEKTHKKMSDTSLKHGDILITKTGRINTENSSLGRAALFLGEDGTANINGHVYLVRLSADVQINRQFILHILTSDIYRELIRRVCVGGIDKRQLNRNHIEEFPIIMPPIELQEEFELFVQHTDKSKFECSIYLNLLKTFNFYKDF